MATGRGTTTVVWSQGVRFDRSTVLVRRRIDGKGWGPVRRLGSGYGAAVASNTANLTVVAWVQQEANQDRVWVARHGAGDSWSSPRLLRVLPKPRLVGGLTPQVDVGEDGSVAVAWDEEIELDTDSRVWSFVSFSPPGGEWVAPHPVVERGWNDLGTRIALDHGLLEVVYPTRSGLWSTSRGVRRPWSAPRKVVPGRHGEHELLRSSDGQTLVVWWRTNAGIAARRRTGGAWEPIVRWRVSQESESAAAVDGSGTVTFAWLHDPPPEQDDGTLPASGVRVRAWPAGRTLGPEQVLLPALPPGGDFSWRYGLRVASGLAGEVVVGFTFSGRTDPPQLRTLVQRRNGWWGPERALRPRADTELELAALPSGGAEALWECPRVDRPNPPICHSRLASTR